MANNKWFDEQFNEQFSDFTVDEIAEEIDSRIKSILTNSFGISWRGSVSVDWVYDSLVATIVDYAIEGINEIEYYVPSLLYTLCNYTDEDFDKGWHSDLWDYLQNCKYITLKNCNILHYVNISEDSIIDDQLKTDDELSFSEKRQVALVDWLLDEPVTNSISKEELWEKNQKLTKLVQELKWEPLELTQSIQEMHNFKQRELKEGAEIINHLMVRIHELEQDKKYNEKWINNLRQRIHDLESTIYLLQRETDQITVLNESVTQLEMRIYQLEQENKQLKSSQLETKPAPRPDKKLTAKKPKFKLLENFAGYQQECDDLINGLSCFYNIKKGKWNGNILQFILTPTDTEKAKHPYPDKWKAGLYLQPGQWKIDKVNLSDPDEWSDWFMDIYDFADTNDIEIS